MLYLNAVVLALVEGITEFLPVSSTGHLILAEQFFSLEAAGGEGFTAAFQVVIQLPAILAVVVYFWRRIWPFAHAGAERTAVFTLWMKIAAAFLPAAVLGLLFDDLIEHYLFHPVPVACALIAGGVVLIVLDRRAAEGPVETVHAIGYGRAVAIGFIQCLAMFPGTSRSAATIIGAMLLGARRPAAAEFSFFLAIPTMVGATSLKLLKGGLDYTPEQWGLIAVGSAVSFLSALVVIAAFMKYIQTRNFVPFGVYRIVLGMLVLAWAYMNLRG